MKTANLFWIVLLVLSLSLTSYLIACNDDDDDDSANDDDTGDDDDNIDDDSTDDDSDDDDMDDDNVDDDSDDDTVNESNALGYNQHEVDVSCNDVFERGQDRFHIYQSAICINPNEEPEFERLYPYIHIEIYYYDEYSWLGVHELVESTGSCYYGFYAAYNIQASQYYFAIAGQVEIVAEGENYRAIYSIEFENGYEFEGSLLLDLCGNPPVGE